MSRRAFFLDQIITRIPIEVPTTEKQIVPSRTKLKVIQDHGTIRYEQPVAAYTSEYLVDDLKYGGQLYKPLFSSNNHGNSPTQPIGVVFVVEHKDFLVVYNDYRTEHREFMLYRVNPKDFFYPLPENIKVPSRYTNIDEFNVRLEDLIEFLDDQFADEVEKNCTFRPVTEDDCVPDGCDTSMDDESVKWFDQRQSELLENFEQLTGFTHFFKGGLIWD